MTANTPAISRSPATGDKPGCTERKRSSQTGFPPDDAPRARRFRLALLLFGREKRSIQPQEMRSGEVCALRERRPLYRVNVTNACVRSGDPIQRFSAAVWRPRPRSAMESRERPSVFICVICGHFWVFGRALRSWRLCGSKWTGGLNSIFALRRAPDRMN